MKSFVGRMKKLGIPLVNVSGQGVNMGIPTVCGDDAMIGSLAAAHFAERMFKNVAWFSSKWGLIQRNRYESFAGEWKVRNNNAAKPPRFVWSEMPKELHKDDWQAFLEWLGEKIDSSPKPLGIFAYSDYDAARVATVCRERGLDVPGEVAVLGVDNNLTICLNQPAEISSVNHDQEKIGYESAALLDRLMDGMEEPAEPLLVKPRGITVRRSTETVAVGNRLLRKAMSFIADNLANPIGAPQIADAIGVSRVKLDRMFAKEFGRSVGREIARQRLVNAKVLLSSTKMTLAEIAQASGYCNAAYLANVFKRETGMRPFEFRTRSPASRIAAGRDAAPRVRRRQTLRKAEGWQDLR